MFFRLQNNIDEDKFRIERNQKYLKSVLEKLEIVKNLLGTKPNQRKVNITMISKPVLSGGSKSYTNNNANSKGKKAVGALKFGKFLKK